MGKGLKTRSGDLEAGFLYFARYSPLPVDRCRAAWESLPEREQLGWYRRARAAREAAGRAAGREAAGVNGGGRGADVTPPAARAAGLVYGSDYTEEGD